MKPAIRTAVFPVAGLGTRFLPVTKTVPKEMLPIIDRPLIDYAVAEAAQAGIDHFIFVTAKGKEAIEDYFKNAPALEHALKNAGKNAELAQLKSSLPKNARIDFVLQDEALGLGHAVWCARDLIHEENFAIILPDDLVNANPGCLSQLVAAYGKTGGNIVAVEDVPREHTNRYGVVDVGRQDGALVEVRGLVEKPKPEDAPSTLSIIGRYILHRDVLAELERKDRGQGGEIQLTDAIARLIGRMNFHGLRFDGIRYDCGSKLGFLEANLAFGLEREDIASALKIALGRLAHDIGGN